VLIAARIAQGAGAALMVPQVLTGIQLGFAGSDRARALSLYTIALAGGAVAGQVLGGVLVSADLFGASWRPIFLINVPIGVVVLVAAQLLPPAAGTGPGAGRIDLAGVATLSAALLLIVLPLILARQEQWPAWTWICLGTSVPLLAAFVTVERRREARGGSPLLNLHVLARPPISWGLSAQAVAVSTYYALLFTLALYMQEGLNRGPLTSGLVLVSWVVAFGIPGRLLDRLPSPLAPLAAPSGCLLLALAYLAISAVMFGGDHPLGLLVLILGLGALGLGTSFSAMLNHLTRAATPRYAADISGVFTTSLQVAGAVGVAAFGTAYLGLIGGPGAGAASHALALVSSAFAITALLAGGMAYRATRAAPPAAPRSHGTSS
jgi:Major Facilitator Superfamily